MGRHFEVRAASMAQSAKKKSALYMRASKEIYMAAREGSTDPDNNLALRGVLDKYRGQSIPKDIIERAINKAHGIGAEDTHYVAGRYEAMGSGGWMLIIDTLSDNVTRAFTLIRTAVTKQDAQMAVVNYMFHETGVFVFKGNNHQEVEETLILNDIDLWDVNFEEGLIQVQVNPEHFGRTRDTLKEHLKVKEFQMAEIRMIAIDSVDLSPEDEANFNTLLEKLDDIEDVQAYYHNVNISE